MSNKAKLSIFPLEQQGHVIDHALKCERNIAWIPTTRHVQKLSFYTLTLSLCVGVQESDWNGIERKTDPSLFAVFC